MALQSTQPLTEMSTRNISWGDKYHLHMPIVLKSGSLNFLEPSGPVQACHGSALPLPCPDKVGSMQRSMWWVFTGLSPWVKWVKLHQALSHMTL